MIAPLWHGRANSVPLVPTGSLRGQLCGLYQFSTAFAGPMYCTTGKPLPELGMCLVVICWMNSGSYT